MDNQSVRRGFQVYRQVCSACHAMSFFKFRHIINVAHSEAEIEEIAAEKGEDYIFNLLTGFMDPPAGVTLSEGMHYNPYFGGNAIGMAPPLYNEIIQYEDGTPATMSQLSADVVQFLCWSTEKHRDERKNMMFKGVLMGTFLLIGLLLNKRNDFAGMKTIFVHNRQLRSSVHKAYHGPPKKILNTIFFFLTH